jgi:DNA-binding transcriptional regulator LsrR (DeoR family)
MECPQHRLVALVGTTKIDGSASFYDVIIRVSDTVRAPHYPMPLPVIARSAEEQELLTSLSSVKSLFALVERTDVSFVGVGPVGDSAPLVQDGIITWQEAETLRQFGAVGEITGWAFDASGRVLAEGTNLRVAAAPLRKGGNRLVIRVAMGPSRRAPLRAALTGGLISGLVTDEATAEHLLQR